MTKATKRVRGKISKTKRNRGRNTKYKRKTGGCGCGIGGGKKQKKSNRKTRRRKMKGGSANLEQLPIRYYYPMNKYEISPDNPNQMGNSIKPFSGGKRKKGRKVTGGMISDILHGPQVNISTGFGTSHGAMELYKIQDLNVKSASDVTNQPASNLNNEHTPLLV